MAALQARIRELEQENAKIRKDCAEMRADLDRDVRTLDEREASLLSAAEKAQKMLDGASATLVDLRRVRRENRQLQAGVDDVARDLQVKLELDAKSQEQLSKLLNRRESAERLIAEYEDLFCELLSPPNFALTGQPSVPFNHTTISITTHSLPATLQTAVQMLQSLPSPFREQKLEKKREIIGILLNARNIAYKMAEEIHELELQMCEGGNLRRIQGDVEVKSNQLALVIQAMTRFRFG
jgi:hypothetical protein